METWHWELGGQKRLLGSFKDKVGRRGFRDYVQKKIYGVKWARVGLKVHSPVIYGSFVITC